MGRQLSPDVAGRLRASEAGGGGRRPGGQTLHQQIGGERATATQRAEQDGRRLRLMKLSS